MRQCSSIFLVSNSNEVGLSTVVHIAAQNMQFLYVDVFVDSKKKLKDDTNKTIQLTFLLFLLFLLVINFFGIICFGKK